MGSGIQEVFISIVNMLPIVPRFRHNTHACYVIRYLNNYLFVSIPGTFAKLLASFSFKEIHNSQFPCAADRQQTIAVQQSGQIAAVPTHTAGTAFDNFRRSAAADRSDAIIGAASTKLKSRFLMYCITRKFFLGFSS